MGKLISVVGNSGVGKTTFVQNLCQGTNYLVCLEKNEERPFQELFMHDLKKYAFINQIDFLLYRAQQEIDIRKGESPGIQDGGLDQDYFVFTKLFYHNGYLSEEEYKICKRAYLVLRENLPMPNLFIWLKAPVELIAERYHRRGRRLDIAQVQDLEVIEGLMDNWLSEYPHDSVLMIDTEKEDNNYSTVSPIAREIIEALN